MKQLTYIGIILYLITQTGFAQNNAQSNTYKFNINGSDYDLKEVELNQIFGSVINELLEYRTLKEKDVQLWSNTFEHWKHNLADNTLIWSTYGDRIAKISISGAIFSKEDLGLAEDGSTATGNPNKEKNKARRIAILNASFAKQLTNTLTSYKIK
jgi:hypothetical protein